LPAPIVFEMGNLLLLKLQNKSTLGLTNEVLHLLYLEHITHSDSKLAGYYFLHGLLTHAADSTSSVLAPLPHFSDSVNPINFAAALISYCQEELSKNQTYSNWELSLNFLHELDAHSFPVQVQLKLLDDINPEEIVPISLLVNKLALVLAQNHSTFSKSSVPSAHQLQNKSSNPKQTMSSSTYTHQQGTAHFKTSSWKFFLYFISTSFLLTRRTPMWCLWYMGSLDHSVFKSCQCITPTVIHQSSSRPC
jgi:hypothetical protein